MKFGDLDIEKGLEKVLNWWEPCMIYAGKVEIFENMFVVRHCM